MTPRKWDVLTGIVFYLVSIMFFVEQRRAISCIFFAIGTLYMVNTLSDKKRKRE